MTESGTGQPDAAVPARPLARPPAHPQARPLLRRLARPLSRGWAAPARCVRLLGDQAQAWPDDGAPAQPWADWCAAHPGVRCRVLLGSQWQRVLTLEPAAGPHPLPQGRAVLLERARQCLLHYHGDAATAWPIALWRSAMAVGACALASPSQTVVPAVLAVAAQHGVRLQALQPAWWWALRAALDSDTPLRLAPEALLLLDEEDVATAVALRQGNIVGVLVQRQPAAAAADADAETLAQQQVVDGLAALGLAPDAPVLRQPLWPLAQSAWRLPAWHWASAPDFRPAAPLSRLAWAGLVVAGLTLALAATDTLQAWQALDPAQHPVDELALSGLQRQAETPVLAPRSAGMPLGPAFDAESTDAAAEQAWRAALALPWGAWLAAAEAATAPGVRWLKLDLSDSQMRLEGQAPDLDIALLAAARLGRQPGLRQVVLTRLQQPVAGDPAGASNANPNSDAGAGPAPGPAGRSGTGAPAVPHFELQAQRVAQ